MEEIDYRMLFRWFVGLNPDEEVGRDHVQADLYHRSPSDDQLRDLASR